VLVYGSIIFLLYFSLLLLNKIEKSREDITRLIREDGILHASTPVFEERPKDGLLFIIRSYNESKRIGQVVHNIQAAGYYHILIVDDGSRDSTSEVLEKFEKLILIRHAFNR
jgi:cellulose synthase/poly-beta-1,6-N-acetylglucosamine synthase-like glycosyltransferase